MVRIRRRKGIRKRKRKVNLLPWVKPAGSGAGEQVAERVRQLEVAAVGERRL
jgi:hypothetical protein